MSTTLQDRYRLFFCVTLVSCWVLAQSSGYCWAVSNEIAEPVAPLGEDTSVTESFEYSLEGRPDPFLPFISPKVTAQVLNPDEIIDEAGELSGMQLFEPGQLTLVAVMSFGNKRIGMVEDVTGRGYPLTVGELIGRRGVVTEIDSNKVIITETARTRANKEIKSTVIMRLNKEGDE